MTKFQSFAFVAFAVAAALMTQAASAQTAAPLPAPAANAPAANVAKAPPAMARGARPQNKRGKKVTQSFVVVVSNSRSVALNELDATHPAEHYQRQLSPISLLAKRFL
jgi:hypothetical protein